MKILWASNAPFCGSGYGVQTAMFGQRIRAAGHDLAYYANFGVEGACLDYDGTRIYPGDREWGNRTMVACAAHHGDGLDDVQVIALCDAFVLDPECWPDDGLRIALWAPVDHEPVPPDVRKVLANRQVTPIAMSRFGERMMQQAGLDPLYVPHGVETGLFAPRPEIRPAVRRELGIPEEAFVVGMVAANQGAPTMHRKSFPQMFQAFARFAETRRDAVLYVHTNELVNPGGGLHLRSLANACGLSRDRVIFTDVMNWELGWSRQTLAGAYQAFDVYANPAMGEGFGVGIIEAQACGVPVIVTDWTAMPELCGAGWLVDGDRWYDGPHDAWFKSPSVASIVEALEESYEARDDLYLRSLAREFALRYDADVVMRDYWLPALDALDGKTVREVPPLEMAVA